MMRLGWINDTDLKSIVDRRVGDMVAKTLVVDQADVGKPPNVPGLGAMDPSTMRGGAVVGGDGRGPAPPPWASGEADAL